MEEVRIFRLMRDGFSVHDICMKMYGVMIVEESVKRRGSSHTDWICRHGTEGNIKDLYRNIVENRQRGNLLLDLVDEDWSGHMEVVARRGPVRMIPEDEGMRLLQRGDWMFQKTYKSTNGYFGDSYFLSDPFDYKIYTGRGHALPNLQSSEMPCGRYVAVFLSNNGSHFIKDILRELPAMERMDLIRVAFPSLMHVKLYGFYDGEKLIKGHLVELVHKDSLPWEERLQFTVS